MVTPYARVWKYKTYFVRKNLKKIIAFQKEG